MVFKVSCSIGLLLILGFSRGSGQTQVWTTLSNPSSGVLGQLFVKGGLEGDGINDTNMIRTLSGVTSLQDSSFNSFKFQLTSALQFNHFKLVKGTYKNIVVDVIKDKNVFGNDNYYGNFFVIKAKRADTVDVTIQKSDSITIDPSSLLGDSLIKVALKKVIPWLAEIKVISSTGSSVIYEIINPRVYFEVEIIKFDDRTILSRPKKFSELPFSSLAPPASGSYNDTLYRGDHRTVKIPFNGGILVSLMTMDTIINKGVPDTTFSLGINISQTVASQCMLQPIPYRVPKSPYDLRNEVYDLLDNLFLISARNDQYLFCYINVHAKKIPEGIVFGGNGLSDSIILSYITVKFKRLNQRTL